MNPETPLLALLVTEGDVYDALRQLGYDLDTLDPDELAALLQALRDYLDEIAANYDPLNFALGKVRHIMRYHDVELSQTPHPPET